MRMRGGPRPRRKETLVIRFRTAGVVHVVLTIVLGVVSVNSGNNLLCLVTSLLLGYLLASGVAGWRNVMGAEAWAELPDEIYAGRPFRLVVKARNRRRFASIHMIEVSARPVGEWDGLQEPVRAFFGIVPRGETASRSVWMTLPRRGRAALALDVASAYPFDFFVRWGHTPPESGALVFPAPLSERSSSAWADEGRPDEEEDRPVGAPLDAEEVAGVRPYQAGDPINRIHWKISARTGKLSTRLFEPPHVRSGRTIDLDALVKNGVERGLSIAAGRVVEAGREGVPIGLKDRGVLTPPAPGRAARLDLLGRLALYAPAWGGEERR